MTTTASEVPALQVRMIAPMPGLDQHSSFDLKAVDESGVLWTLRSVTNSSVRLFAVPPEAFFEDYSPQIPTGALEALGLTKDDNPFILVIIHPAQGHYPHTANLLAPLVIHPDTLEAMQVVLEDDLWPLQAPLGDPAE